MTMVKDYSGMTEEEAQAFEWALHQQFQSVAARYARTLAEYIKRKAPMRDDDRYHVDN